MHSKAYSYTNTANSVLTIQIYAIENIVEDVRRTNVRLFIRALNFKDFK